LLADNKLSECSSGDDRQLAVQLKELQEIAIEFDIEATGFEPPEIDLRVQSLDPPDAMDAADEFDPPQGAAVSQIGDLWTLGCHRLMCGSALEAQCYEDLLQGEAPRRCSPIHPTTADLHPTVKPVKMVVDALLDVTRQDDIVLDLFCGSGTTLLAAERTGRQGCGIELDPLYVDLTIRRWQQMTGRLARHRDGRSFDEVLSAGARSAEGPRGSRD
jgi:hypothetical protein